MFILNNNSLKKKREKNAFVLKNITAVDLEFQKFCSDKWCTSIILKINLQCRVLYFPILCVPFCVDMSKLL